MSSRKTHGWLQTLLSLHCNSPAASLPIQTLFEANTVAALAGRIDTARATPPTEPPPAMACGGKDRSPATSIVQERVLGIERELPGLPQFNLPFAYRLQGPLSVPALEQSLAEVVRRLQRSS